MSLRLGTHTFEAGELAIMAIVNRTPDSFFDRGATFARDAALAAVERAVDEGAVIVDIGGVKAGPGTPVSVGEEIDRVAGVVADVRAQHPAVVISVDTWRAEVGEAVVAAGADLLNDAWGGYDPRLAEVAARTGAGLVCTHTGGTPPRTRPHRVAYADVVADVTGWFAREIERARRLGVRDDGLIVDPGHDFGKNTWHSLEVTRRLAELTGFPHPLLVSLSNKDFVGESLGGLPTGERLEGTLATTAVCAWLGARIFRAHQVRATRRVLDMVGAILGEREPAAVRGLA